MKRTASRVAFRAAALYVRLGAVALMAACGDGSDGPRVDFAITHTDQVKGVGSTPLDLPPEPAIVQGGAGAVEAHGLVAAPDECDNLAAEVEPGDSMLTLRVVVRGSRSHPGACGAPGGFALFQWRARIAPVEPGQHQVRILYDYRGLRRHPSGDATAGGRGPFSDQVVAERTVTVQSW